MSFCDRSANVARALANAFAGADAVEVLEGDLLGLDCDALLSPANSFGDMGGGVDRAIDAIFGGRAQEAVTNVIRDEFLGELPVGMAAVVPTGGARFPWLIAAPTMRVPGSVRGRINAYLAMRAALVAVLRHNARAGGRVAAINTLTVPGLCTGVGGMSYGESAAQARAAYDNVAAGGWRDVTDPAAAPYAAPAFRFRKV